MKVVSMGGTTCEADMKSQGLDFTSVGSEVGAGVGGGLMFIHGTTLLYA